MLLADAIAQLAAACREDLLEEVVAADGLDGGQQARRERVVVRREEVLGVRGDVVQVARPADAVADGLAADEVRRLERAQLLEDAGPARAESVGQLVRRARAVEPEPEEQVAAESGRTARWTTDPGRKAWRRARAVASSSGMATG